MTYKKVLTVQDISCIGQCSLTVALPIISACGIETVILPSAVLSTHTGKAFGTPFIRDLTMDMEQIAEHWSKLNLKFDCMYTGYLGDKKQIEFVKNLMKTHLSEGALKIIDPVMADYGKLYSGFDNNFVLAMRTLCEKADYLLPNITEAAFLTGMEYRENNHDEAYVENLLLRIGELGAEHVVLKGISFAEHDDEIGIAVYDAGSGQMDYYFTKRLPLSCHGTGDCFASAFTGAIMNGMDAKEAARFAADFVRESIQKTSEAEDAWYGVKFEKALPMLIERITTF